MKRKYYNITYALIMVVVVATLLFANLSDSAEMLLGIFVILLTSIFTYSNRHAISRKRR